MSNVSRYVYLFKDEDVLQQVMLASGVSQLSTWRCSCGLPECQAKVFIARTADGRVFFASNVSSYQDFRCVHSVTEAPDIDAMLQDLDDGERDLWGRWLKADLAGGLREEILSPTLLATQYPGPVADAAHKLSAAVGGRDAFVPLVGLQSLLPDMAAQLKLLEAIRDELTHLCDEWVRSGINPGLLAGCLLGIAIRRTRELGTTTADIRQHVAAICGEIDKASVGTN